MRHPRSSSSVTRSPSSSVAQARCLPGQPARRCRTGYRNWPGGLGAARGLPNGLSDYDQVVSKARRDVQGYYGDPNA